MLMFKGMNRQSNGLLYVCMDGLMDGWIGRKWMDGY